jgi:hypothetical protein
MARSTRTGFSASASGGESVHRKLGHLPSRHTARHESAPVRAPSAIGHRDRQSPPSRQRFHAIASSAGRSFCVRVPGRSDNPARATLTVFDSKGRVLCRHQRGDFNGRFADIYRSWIMTALEGADDSSGISKRRVRATWCAPRAERGELPSVAERPKLKVASRAPSARAGLRHRTQLRNCLLRSSTTYDREFHAVRQLNGWRVAAPRTKVMITQNEHHLCYIDHRSFWLAIYLIVGCTRSSGY